MPAQSVHLRATVLPDGDAALDLWIVDGRLTFVPQSGAVELAPPGGYVLPGLVDCHVHLTLDHGDTGLPLGSAELVAANARAQLTAGVLLVRDIGASRPTPVELPSNVPKPHLQAAGGFLAPAGKYLPFGQFVAAEELASAALAQVAAGAVWVKIIADWNAPVVDAAAAPQYAPNYPAQTLADTVAAVHRAGSRVAVHVMGRRGIADCIAAGVDSLEHGLELDESLLADMAAKGIAWTPTLTSLRRSQAQARRPVSIAYLRERLDHWRVLLPEADRLGIALLAGTDVLPPGSIAQEIAALQESGLEPRRALAAATTTARSFLAAVGLTEGAPADLVLYRADPREDPEVLVQPECVLLHGQRVA